jgi:hypothetical protein
LDVQLIGPQFICEKTVLLENIVNMYNVAKNRNSKGRWRHLPESLIVVILFYFKDEGDTISSEGN